LNEGIDEPGNEGAWMSMRIGFAGNKVVHAETKGFTITTDVPSEPGGRVMAPSPVDLLLASLGTRTSYYVLHFCEQRGMASTTCPSPSMRW